MKALEFDVVINHTLNSMPYSLGTSNPYILVHVDPQMTRPDQYMIGIIFPSTIPSDRTRSDFPCLFLDSPITRSLGQNKNLLRR